jgi:hypothetical protein
MSANRQVSRWPSTLGEVILQTDFLFFIYFSKLADGPWTISFGPSIALPVEAGLGRQVNDNPTRRIEDAPRNVANN